MPLRRRHRTAKVMVTRVTSSWSLRLSSPSCFFTLVVVAIVAVIPPWHWPHASFCCCRRRRCRTAMVLSAIRVTPSSSSPSYQPPVSPRHRPSSPGTGHPPCCRRRGTGHLCHLVIVVAVITVVVVIVPPWHWLPMPLRRCRIAVARQVPALVLVLGSTATLVVVVMPHRACVRAGVGSTTTSHSQTS